MNRRNFLGAMLAACAAPAIVRAGSLMRINPAIVTPTMEIGSIERFRFVVSDPVIIQQYGTDIGFGARGYAGIPFWNKILIDNNGWMETEK